MKKILLTLCFVFTLAYALPTLAVNCAGNNSDCVKLQSALPGVNSVPQLIGTIIRGALGVIGAVTLLMFIWGGLQWLLAAGNAEKIDKGTQTMLWAVIGLVLVFSSYFIVSQLTSLLKK